MGEPVTSVDFHFDVMCPWAFQAGVVAEALIGSRAARNLRYTM